MESNCLIDTNILIHYTDGSIPEANVAQVNRMFTHSFNVSVISRIEFLGWHKWSPAEFEQAQSFLETATVLTLNRAVAERTVALKRKVRLKTPDAVIAATALENGLVLATRNTKDFRNIAGLKLYNPMELG